MRLHRLDGDEELLPHLAVGVSPGDEPHHLLFTFGEFVEVFVGGGHFTTGGVERVEHKTSEPWRKHRIARCHPPHGVGQVRP